MTHALQLTSPGTAAIAVILVAGDAAASVLERVTGRGGISMLPRGKATRVRITDPAAPAGAPLDDALLIATGAERFELHLHGGVAVVRAVLEALSRAGAEVTTAERAPQLLGGLFESEVLLALPQAATPTALRLLCSQGAALGEWAKSWCGKLEEAGAGRDDLRVACRELLARSAVLMRLLAPPRVAIVGPPNAGKSTLANALLGRPVSITSNVPGTTRDWVDARAVLSGPSRHFAEGMQVEVTLIDTAGIRATADELEARSIERTHAQAAGADLIVVVFDASIPRGPEDEALLARYRDPIVVWNKMDAREGEKLALPPGGAGVVRISARERLHLDALMGECVARLGLGDVRPSEPFLFTPRQREVAAEVIQAENPKKCIALL
ncbi:MAG TPA: GTPase, partial [Phycisphaerae bacterium]|nr:GTPase [Phycisphaerae bacterium]